MTNLQEWEQGNRLRFPDGDTAIIVDWVKHTDEEDDKGTYDAIQVMFVIEGDKDKQVFEEMLDSRENYKFNVMKPI